MLGALAPHGEEPELVWTAPPGKIDSAVLLDFFRQEVAGLPAPPNRLPADDRRARNRVVVSDNASAHTSKAVKALRPALAAAGVTPYYLPPDSPELNRIEELGRHITYDELAVRSDRASAGLRVAVEQAWRDHAASLHGATSDLAEAA